MTEEQIQKTKEYNKELYKSLYEVYIGDNFQLAERILGSDGSIYLSDGIRICPDGTMYEDK